MTIPEETDEADRARARGRRRIAALVDLLLPPRCVVCRGRLAASDCLCGRCWAALRFIRHPLCERLGIPLPYDSGPGTMSAQAIAHPPAYDRARAALLYRGAAPALVHGFKYSDRPEVGILFGRWMAAAGADLLRDADAIVPVPLARRRLIWRRFNQAAVLASEISRLAGVPSLPFALARRRATRPQVGLTESQRRINVAGAFVVPEVSRAAIAGKRIVLVDDVVTTGATVEAAAGVLKRAGAASVDVLAVALVADTV